MSDDFDPTTVIIEAETIHHLPLRTSDLPSPVEIKPPPLMVPPHHPQVQVPSHHHHIIHNNISSCSEHSNAADCTASQLTFSQDTHLLSKQKHSLPECEQFTRSSIPFNSSTRSSRIDPTIHARSSVRHEVPIALNYCQQKQRSTTNVRGSSLNNSPTQTNSQTLSPLIATPSPMFLNPFQVFDKMKQEGIRKSKLAFDQIIILSLFAGCFTGIGGALSLLTAGNSPTLETENPGLQKFFFGAVFPIGMIFTILFGAELFSTNSLTVFIGLLSRKWKSKKFILQYLQFSKNLCLSYIFNMVGAFMVAYFFLYLTQPCCDVPWITFAKKVALSKVSKSFGQLVLLGVICNMMLTLAIYISFAATTVEGKIIGIWFPVMGFVASGFEHCVANAFFIPLGMLFGEDISVQAFLIQNLLPTTIGNIIGGSFIVGLLLYYVHDLRHRNRRFLFNTFERIWRYLKQRHFNHSLTRSSSTTPLSSTTVGTSHLGFSDSSKRTDSPSTQQHSSLELPDEVEMVDVVGSNNV
ncbi:hypothetical protein C9374_003897 [Naegleria lovaniensis]|uniref:Formate/nitrite transporter n=1 Tax=Naegleria lovaniensis TaxID=51637 RepID=A0AA88KQE3_NAELO|nr:uncharacterized protein C9374_003897 [Naegleria lovaniensis]KAG2394133.1 hypothetical protein C9374_003897 [Naegleria lovaniensis]